MCFKKVRTERIEYIDGAEVDQGTLEKWFPMDHRYRVPHLIMITYEVEGKPQTVLVHIRGNYQSSVTNKNRAGYRAGFFPGQSEPIQVMGPKLPRITHISSYVQGPDQMMIWITIWERRNHNEVTESESDQRERGDRPGSGEPSVQEEQEKGQDEPTEERSPGSVEATDPDHINKMQECQGRNFFWSRGNGYRCTLCGESGDHGWKLYHGTGRRLPTTEGDADD